jgi:glycosyltransferase involved in cell wall biosynthesis
VSSVHVVVPDGIDDPSRPSGGNVYDRRLCDGLIPLGWTVREHPVPGAWPAPDETALTTLAGAVAEIPDDAVVLIDGLVASAAPEVLVPQARRLRLVALVHMPLGHRPPVPDAASREASAFAAVSAIVTTSAWTRRRIAQLYAVPDDRIHVAEPGADRAEPAVGTPSGGALLCVGAVIFAKGHDLLCDALAQSSDLTWECVCVGNIAREPAFVDCLRRQAADRGLGDRLTFVGPRTGPELDHAYAAADLLVLPSRLESYGMVITEALARGIPAVAADVGGVREALGESADGGCPAGLLVAPDDAAALARALRDWLGGRELRQRLRAAARARRATLRGWPSTAASVSEVLTEVSR